VLSFAARHAEGGGLGGLEGGADDSVCPELGHDFDRVIPADRMRDASREVLAYGLGVVEGPSAAIAHIRDRGETDGPYRSDRPPCLSLYPLTCAPARFRDKSGMRQSPHYNNRSEGRCLEIRASSSHVEASYTVTSSFLGRGINVISTSSMHTIKC
jgi:hypothetical protein